MRVKEKTQGVLIAKHNNLMTLFFSSLFVLAGIFATISLTIPNFDLSTVETYLGPAFLLTGASLILFGWKRTKIIFDKNQNTFLIKMKTMLNDYEKKGNVQDIAEIAYSESFKLSVSTGRGRGSSRQILKVVEMRLNNGEVHTIFENQGTYNPLLPNRTKNNAQKIADFLGLPLQTFTTRDAFRQVGQAIMNQFNPNAQQLSTQQAQQRESQTLRDN